MTDFSQLRAQLAGEIRDDAATLAIYATDASVYQVRPLAVAFPKSADDCRKIVAFCRDHRIPVTGRGGGTSLSGQAIGPGIVIDFSRHMNRILEIDAERGLVRVEPGVILDELNKKVAPTGRYFVPDPATMSRCSIGGMVGNNSCGRRSLLLGRTSDSTESLQVLLADGTEFTTRRMDRTEWDAACQRPGREGEIYRDFTAIVERQRDEIEARFPKLSRLVAGYALNSFLGEERSLSDLLCGSEGTLGLVLEATLRLTVLPKETSVVVLGFDSLDDALRPLPIMMEHQPAAIELMDDTVIGEALRNASTRDIAAFLVAGGKAPHSVHLVEFLGDTREEVAGKARAFVAAMKEKGIGSQHHLCLDAAEQHRAWEVRRLSLGLISNVPGKRKGVSTIEDACVPIEHLADYSRFVFDCCHRHGLHTATYAHASVGVLHFEARLDLHEPEDRAKLRALGEECFAECLRLGGVFSGEHGDGIVRGEFVERQFGSRLFMAFREVKSLFDPLNLMNPGRKLDALPLDGPLRYGDSSGSPAGAPKDYPQRVAGVQGLFRYGEQEGLAGAVEQCNGVGACRKLGSGNMCPSFRATNDEAHATRGRANALRMAISGQLGVKSGAAGLADPALHETLELCLSCKACKSECPNAVDMAKLKSEALQAKWDAEGVSPKARLIGDLPTRAGQFGGTFLGKIGTALSKTGLVRRLMASRYGIDRRRELPEMAPRNLDQLLRDQGLPSGKGSRKVALFADTWSRFFEPEIGLAAVELLESCGFAVTLTRSHDAQRPRLSAGLVREAKQHGAAVFAELRQLHAAGIPVLCIEPSEASALVDDLPDLLDETPGQPTLQQVAANVRLIDDFLATEIERGLQLRPKESAGSLMLHPHCHQRALFTAASPKKILEAAGFAVSAPETGCCGMAGSFGYAHHELSQKIGEDRLFPAVRAAKKEGRAIVATGSSCRQQLHDFTRTEARHWVQLVRGTQKA
ncbi:MAG: Anaerobic glycerol-3-phosphate dehydrogenase subunit [Verrucomicrobiota bacterium]|jgi:FAD/FMN-containing dehydrogenase/Fe-S oxidoreductase